MIMPMFFFAVLLAVLIFAFGAASKTPIVLAVAGVLFIGLGAGLLFGGELEHQVGNKAVKVDANTWDINDVYSNLTVDNDLPVLATANFLFYGGFGALMLAGAGYFIKAYRKEED